MQTIAIISLILSLVNTSIIAVVFYGVYKKLKNKGNKKK